MNAPGIPVYLLRLGATAGVRPAEADVAAIVRDYAESFSLAAESGWFRDAADPGWVITLAHPEPARIVHLAHTLRRHFRQESVGIEAFGRHLRCREDTAADTLAADLRRVDIHNRH